MDDDAPLVAVVDDEESIRHALVRLLRSARYRAEAFSSGVAFLASLSDRVPSCLILDLQMPLMTGLDVQQELRKLGTSVPVIVITAHDEPGTRERSLALGARHYFCKPIDGAVLMNAIAGAVRKQ
jgi:FixJ family two-component response regulator